MGRTRPDLPMNGEDPGLYLIYVALIVCDVGPRDGLQNEPRALEPAVRAELCDRLAAAGLRRIEAASLVNPKLVPHMARPEERMTARHPVRGPPYPRPALNLSVYHHPPAP